jgi:hypothetical protein
MSLKYSENHHLSGGEEGANVHVALHLQGATLQRAMEFVDCVLEAAGGFVLEGDTPVPLLGETVLRPQTSGPCVHIDAATEDDPGVIQRLGLGTGREEQEGDAE